MAIDKISALKTGNPAILLTAVLVFMALSAPLGADVVTLHDGRWIEGKVEEQGDTIKIELVHGSITIPALRVKDILIDVEGKLNRKQKAAREKIEKAIEETRKHSMWRDHYVEETKHFVFNYNVTPEIAKGYIDMLEEFYNDFKKQLGAPLLPGVKRKKMEVNIFRDQENYLQVGGSPGTAGYWNFVDERLFFYHDRNDPEYTLSVLLHEFTHLLTHLLQPKFCHPIWCNEGLAEYYGASIQDGKKLIFGGIQEGRLVSMNKWREDDNSYTLQELMSLSPNRFGGLEYGWAWSFVHFMMNSKYKKKFMKYYIGLAKTKSVKREQGYYYYPTVMSKEDLGFFLRIYGLKNLDKLTEEWHAYIDQELKVTTGAGYLYEGKVLHRKGDYKEALEALETAEEKWEGEPSPLLFYYRGLCLKAKNKYDSAREAFMKAIELDPLNGRYYYYLGDCIESLDEDDLMEEAIRNKNMAREIEPDDYSLRYWVESDELDRKKKEEDEG